MSKDRRKMANRRSARRSRARVKRRLEEADEMEEENIELKRKNRKLETEVQRLTDIINIYYPITPPVAGALTIEPLIKQLAVSN